MCKIPIEETHHPIAIMAEKAIIQFIKADELHFDFKNPRLVEFQGLADEESILNVLWKNMDINELVMSILASGFFESEALYVVCEEGKLIVIEGNRRLAAVKAILHPDLIKGGGMSKYGEIPTNIIDQLTNSIPVIEMSHRRDAWRYIGFKHVNGPAKWDSYAKAQYIALVHDNYGVPLEDIATQIGDSNKITLRLYQGLMLINQADRQTDFKIDDVYSNRLYFSHVYTAMNYESMQRYLELDLSEAKQNPVPEDKLDKLEEVLTWILGSKKKSLPAVVKSQNPGIRQLCQVLEKPDAVQLLRAGNTLEVAFEGSKEGVDVLYEAIVDARNKLEKALSKIASYDGNEDLLKTVINLADSADSLYKSMKEIRQTLLGKSQKERTID